MYNTLKSQEAFLNLPEEDRLFIKDYKHHIEANKMEVERILKMDHPKSRNFYDWINICSENKSWYFKNANKVKLVPDGIEILWDVYDLEDTIPPKDATRWSRTQATKFLLKSWKRIPSWWKLISILPDKFRQEFLYNVMWFQWRYLWADVNQFHTSKDRVVLWSKYLDSGKLRCISRKK